MYEQFGGQPPKSTHSMQSTTTSQPNPILHIALCVNGSIKSAVPEETNVYKLYTALQQLPERDHLATHYRHDPCDNKSWPWLLRKIANFMGLSMGLELENAYQEILQTLTQMGEGLKADQIFAFDVHFHFVGAGAGGTLLLQLSNQLNARLQDDLNARNIFGLGQSKFSNMIFFDCDEEALAQISCDPDTGRVRSTFLQRMFLNKVPDVLSVHVPRNAKRVIHFVAADESKRVILFDRAYVHNHVKLEEIWMPGNRDDICTASSELLYAINCLNQSHKFQNANRLQVTVVPEKQRSISGKRYIRVVRDGKATLEPPYISPAVNQNQKNNLSEKNIAGIEIDISMRLPFTLRGQLPDLSPNGNNNYFQQQPTYLNMMQFPVIQLGPGVPPNAPPIQQLQHQLGQDPHVPQTNGIGQDPLVQQTNSNKNGYFS